MGSQETAIQKPALVLFDVKGNHEGILTIKSVFEKNTQIRVDCVKNATDLLAPIRQAGRAVFVFSVTDKDDLVESMKALAVLEKMIKLKLVKAVGFNSLNNPKIEKLLRDKGCSETLHAPLGVKACQTKFDRLLKVVENAWTEFSAKGEQKGVKELKNSQKTAEPTKVQKGAVRFRSPVKIASDCWILLKKKEARMVAGKWMIEMLGPVPACGKWEAAPAELKNNFEDTKEIWEWKPREVNKDPFIKDPGSWIFVGRMPEFSWKTYRWLMVGTMPVLAFVHKGEVIETRFSAQEMAGMLMITENSDAGRGFLPIIQKMIEAEARFKKDAEGKALEGKIDLEIEPDVPDFVDKKEDNNKEWNQHESKEEEKAGWNQHDLSKEKEKDWKEGDLSPDKSSAAPVNQGDLSPDAPKKAWTQHDLSPEQAQEWGDLLESLGPFVHLTHPKEGTVLKVKFVDQMDSTVIVEVRSGFAIAQQDYPVKIEAFQKGFKLQIENVAKILNVDSISDVVDSVELLLPENSLADLERLRTMISARQKSIFNFMKEVKGHG